MERIIANLDKVKLKLDEAFFYLDEIEELVQDEVLDGEAASRVGEANDRLTKELSSLGHKVAELQDILRALEEREEGGRRAKRVRRSRGSEGGIRRREIAWP